MHDNTIESRGAYLVKHAAIVWRYAPLKEEYTLLHFKPVSAALLPDLKVWLCLTSFEASDRSGYLNPVC